MATAKGPVERKVVRVVTPGTVTDSELLAETSATAAAGRAPAAQHLRPGLAGARPAASSAWPNAASELARLAGASAPAEVLLDGRAWHDPAAGLARARTARPAWQFDTALGQRKLLRAAAGGHPGRLQRAGPAGGACRRRRAAAATPNTPRARRWPTCAACRCERDGELLDLPPATHRNLELTADPARRGRRPRCSRCSTPAAPAWAAARCATG